MKLKFTKTVLIICIVITMINAMIGFDEHLLKAVSMIHGSVLLMLMKDAKIFEKNQKE